MNLDDTVSPVVSSCSTAAMRGASAELQAEIKSIFFFFQAEDGIRYIGVTGVQTCALPIYCGSKCKILILSHVFRSSPISGLKSDMPLRPGSAKSCQSRRCAIRSPRHLVGPAAAMGDYLAAALERRQCHPCPNVQRTVHFSSGKYRR